MHAPHVSAGGRYPVLRALAILQIFAAVLVAVGGIVTSFNVHRWVGPTGFPTAVAVTLGLVGTFFTVVLTLAFAELIKLLIDIEHNTRMAAHAAQPTATATQTTVVPVPGADGARVNRIAAIVEEETAEAALIRGH